MATEYLIQSRLKQGTYISVLTADASTYAWTVERSGAKRYSRDAALAAAQVLDAEIKRRGYNVKPVRIVPASGGSAIRRTR